MNYGSTYADNKSRVDSDYCKRYIRTYSSNYFLASLFFPRTIRDNTIILYAFLRYFDEIVDNPPVSDVVSIKENFDESYADWKNSLYIRNAAEIQNPIFSATRSLADRTGIPESYFDDFLHAMMSDQEVSRYVTYNDLKKYMWGSAGVVGHMMTYIIGWNNQRAFDHAQALGEAMQLVNFMRDIREDYEQRNRIYIPLDEMAQFGVTEKTIQERSVNKNFVDLMEFQSKRIYTLFSHAEEGIPYLEYKGRRSVRISLYIYRDCLREIERNGYDVFSRRISVPTWKKLFFVISAYVKPL